MLWDKVGMAAQAVAGALDLDNDSVMQELVDQCGRDDWIADDFAPFREPAVRSEDHGALFVASVDELEEQVWTCRVFVPLRVLV